MASESTDKETEKTENATFLCSVCGFKSRFDYYGKKPHFYKACVLLEDAYIMKDPFSDVQQSMIILGSHCASASCTKSVCAAPDCSLFYTKRYCLPCVSDNLDEFPVEIQLEVRKRLAKR